MVQVLDPEIAKIMQFLDQEIEEMDNKIYGSRDRRNGAISGSRNRRKGWQILYQNPRWSPSVEICLRYTVDMLVECLGVTRNSYKMCMRYIWYLNLHEINMRLAWDMHEIFMRFAWDLHKICLRYAWDLHVICQWFVWDLFVICVKLPRIFLRFS